MKEQFVTYKQALKLKELEFDEECLAYYDYPANNLIIENTFGNLEGHYKYRVTAPLWQQAFDWFSKEYNLQSSIKPVTNVTEIGYAFDIVTIKFNMVVSKFPLSRKETKYYKTHEDAREACLKKLIEIGKEIQENNTRTSTKTV